MTVANPGAADLSRDALTTLLPGFAGTELPGWVRDRLAAGLGGVCVFGPNIASPEQLAALNDRITDANPHAVIAIDEEGGDVTRLFYDVGAPYPGNAVLGRIDDVAYTEEIGRRVGEALRASGCTLAFAPDVDVNSNPDNPVIGTRSFGTDPELVARHSVAWTRGLQSTGVAASAKHFPGHGDTDADSHVSLPVVDRSADELATRELVPFRAAIAAGARTVMTSHILLPQLDADHPATLSPRVLRLLRAELGFEGVVVSDALDMHGASGVHGIPEAAVRALVAGCDLLCIGTDTTEALLDEIVQAVLAAVADGRLPEERVTDAAGRVRALADAARPSEAPAAPLDRDAELRRIAASFEVTDAARERLAQGAPATLVRLESEANIAIGVAPWGIDSPDAIVVRPGDASLEASALTGPVLVIGRDVHRHDFARAAVDALRAARPDVIVVEMGWPGADRAYADLATFGASRLVGDALLVALDDLAPDPVAAA
ncbi:glycoside hydrolase family 3 protein [Agromyces mangrovi Wang et al. 2018]|uniref:glycoside hydrolase family 3 protein n=1 Tax=Agromyces mangrovi TaxID=1858653 RepID=UPI0025725ADC|nr:glycoside hydrolase family 3 N-terminal domain-containing protein [Agromyces mangrovi]BDZ63766.1 sugar hydrolase [Agromyces mangrovi]